MTSPQQNINKLHELRLKTMADTYQVQLDQPKLQQQLSFDDRLGLLVEAETSARENRRLTRTMKRASLPEAAVLEDVEHAASRGIDKAFLSTLASCDWIRRRANLFITGPTGVGKTWLASAMGNQACRLKFDALFKSARGLYQEIIQADLDGSTEKLIQALCKPSLLIIDDLGLTECPGIAAQVIFDVIDKRSRTGALLVTSQIPVEEWYHKFPDPTLADAILDRIVHQAYRIELKGESMRKIRGRKQIESRG